MSSYVRTLSSLHAATDAQDVFLTPAEVAAILKVTERKLVEWRKETLQKLEYYLTTPPWTSAKQEIKKLLLWYEFGGEVRYSASDLRKYICGRSVEEVSTADKMRK